MLFYKVHFDGTEQEIRAMIQKISEYDKYFPKEEIRNDFDFMDEENPEFSNVEEIEEIAKALVSKASNAKFSIVGTVENHGYYMDFEIEYDSKKLTRKKSDWYVSYYLCEDNFEDYEEFCDETDLGDRVSEEQFDEWIEEECEIAVVKSGDGPVYKKAPLSEPIVLYSKKLGRCPVCGEQLDHITPIITSKDGKMYHIWCAEEKGIEGEMW